MQKKLHRRCSTGLKIGFWLRVWNLELTLVPSLQIKPRKYLAGIYVWHRFWKGTRSCFDSKQNECLCSSSRANGFLKKVLWEISHNSQKNICAGISFLLKLNSVDPQLHWNRVFRTSVFLWNLRNLLEHLFCRGPPDDCFWL